MYEREETKTTTHADGKSEHYKINEKASSGLTELFLIPVGLCLTAVICGLILQLGIRLSHSINQEDNPTSGGTHYTSGL